MTEDKTMFSSVIICTRDRPQELECCLRAVFGLDYPEFDVIVVDNGSDNANTRRIVEQFPAKYVCEPQLGLSRARNRGAKAARGEIVAYIDDDAVPARDWLREIANGFVDPHVAVVSGPYIPLSQRDYPPSEQIPFCGYLFREAQLVDKSNALWFEMANFGGLGDGSNMAFRRNLFQHWAGFDERMGLGAHVPGGEEHYALFQVLDQGHAVLCTPRVIIYHPTSELQSKHRRAALARTPYIMILLTEYPQYRGRVLRFVGQALLGCARPWRTSSHRRVSLLVLRGKEVPNALRGLWIFLRRFVLPRMWAAKG